MPQLWRPWRHPRYALGSPILGWPFTRARSRRPRRSRPCRRPTSRSGGRSSKPPASRPNKLFHHPERTMTTKRGFVLALAASAATSAVYPSFAQVYPARPITIVVPFAAGGPTDMIGRILAERMRVSLGQPVVIENVAGAGGSLGVGRVARAAPDGYTLVVGIQNTHVLNGVVYTLAYDPVKDFEPIALTARTSPVVVARKTMPAKDLNELIAWLKANPNKASQATAGVGSPQHISGLFFQSLTGTEFQFVPY